MLRVHVLPNVRDVALVLLVIGAGNGIVVLSALSFLGIGLRPPAISLGVLLQQAQNVKTISLYPWLMAPGVFIFIVVLAFNFMGDGLRDAADPYR